MGVVTKVQETITCGDFRAEVTVTDGEIKELIIKGKSGRGTNQLIIKGSIGPDLEVLDLKELASVLLTRY